jgi:hypothetical protein
MFLSATLRKRGFLQALAAICKEEDDPRLASLDRRGLAKVQAHLLGHPPSSEPVLAALTVIASLARATPNRCAGEERGGREVIG